MEDNNTGIIQTKVVHKKQQGLGIVIVVTSKELGVDFRIDIPEFDRELLETANPVFQAIFEHFDGAVADIDLPPVVNMHNDDVN